MLGDLIVIAAIAAVVALAVRSMWRDRKKGGCCGGCSGCSGCAKGSCGAK